VCSVMQCYAVFYKPECRTDIGNKRANANSDARPIELSPQFACGERRDDQAGARAAKCNSVRSSSAR